MQRVPATETQGRVHTSAATVALLFGKRPQFIITLRFKHLPRFFHIAQQISIATCSGNQTFQGRVHTSAATVAVLPEAEEFDVEINEGEIKWDTFRSGGAGGQPLRAMFPIRSLRVMAILLIKVRKI